MVYAASFSSFHHHMRVKYELIPMLHIGAELATHAAQPIALFTAPAAIN